MRTTTLIVLVTLWTTGCEYTADIGELPYSERLVISGFLFRSNAAVRVGRTLRFNEIGSPDTVSDALVRVGVGNSGFVLTPQPSGTYRFDGQLNGPPGVEWQLVVEWNGKVARATTRIPSDPEIDTILVTTDNLSDGARISVDAAVVPRHGEVYHSDWLFFASDSLSGRGEYATAGPLRMEDVSSDGRIHFVKVFTVISGSLDSVRFLCMAYDMPYYDYYVSRGNPYLEGVPLYSYFSGPVKWNVTGDGVGLFVGTASNSKVVHVR